MDNEAALKRAFRELQAKIFDNVNPDSAIDILHSKEIISDTEYEKLYDDKDPKSRCRQFLFLLRNSSHPETFIHLREALVEKYPLIVDEIDKKLGITPQTVQQQQQLQQGQSTGGKFLLPKYNFA